MISIVRDSDAILTLVSDDEHAENAVLGDAIGHMAPHWLEAWEQTPVGEDGLLRFSLAREEWPVLLEVLECAEPDVDPADTGPMMRAIAAALEEQDG